MIMKITMSLYVCAGYIYHDDNIDDAADEIKDIL